MQSSVPQEKWLLMLHHPSHSGWKEYKTILLNWLLSQSLGGVELIVQICPIILPGIQTHYEAAEKT